MDNLLLGVLAIQLRLAEISLERMQPVAEAAILQPTDYQTYASTTAQKYGVDPEIFTSVLRCESHFKADAVGDNETSFGIAQIHLVSHPEVTKDEALDGVWAINWSAKQFAKGNGHIWSCFKNLGYGST